MTPLRIGTGALAALLAFCAAGCRLLRPMPENPDAAAADSPAGQAQPAGIVTAPLPERIGRLDDQHIAAMLLALNNTDISYARLVPSRTLREDVRQFAQRMLTDHTGVNALLTETLQKLDMAPEDNHFTLDMRDESANRRDAMAGLTGFAFDSAYIANEVSYHQRFLATLDQVMLPAVRRPDLHTMLTTVRPAIAAHLAHAEQVWANVMAARR